MNQRIESLRTVALNRSLCQDEFYYRFYRRFSGNTGDYAAYGEAFRAALAGLTPEITPGELIVGEFGCHLTEKEAAEWESTYKSIADKTSRFAGLGQDSHMAVDYELLLRDGVEGILRKIEGYMAACSEESRAFYACCRECLLGVMEHARAYSRHARRLAMQEGDPQRRSELERIAEICEKVPAQPAASFYEAVQSVHFVTYCLSMNPLRFFSWQQFQLGHPDRYLEPFYRRDLESGKITREFAQLLLDLLGIQINMRVCSGLSSGYMVGGRDAQGRVVAGDLTEMCMQVVDDIRLVYPAVGLCYTPEMPDSILEKACNILLHGRSHPAIFNDDVITAGLASYGVKNPHDYIHSTCVEITPVGASNVWVASPYTNMAQILLDCLERPCASFREFMDALFVEIDDKIRIHFEEENAHRRHRAAHSMNPLLSCFVHDCLETGVDIEKGGAKYNWIMPSFVGMANLVDSVYAVNEMVFRQKKLTLSQLKQALDANFEGYEPLRLELLNALPKYGNDNDDIDRYFGLFTEHIIAECKKYTPVLPNAKLIPSVFCWIMHERFGVETGATPDGRKAGFPLGDGSGPCQGREKCGPTASILSSTKWQHQQLIGGVAVNMKFSRSSLGPNSAAVLMALAKTYLARGGFEFQINVVDQETLEKARKNPEAYSDLVVRIGGYSDYFVRLTPEMQEEIILRTAHGL